MILKVDEPVHAFAISLSTPHIVLDSTFDGSFHAWKKYPNWKGKYGFAVVKCPESEKTRLHVDNSCKGTPQRAVVRYRSLPPVDSNMVQLSRKLSPTQVYFQPSGTP